MGVGSGVADAAARGGTGSSFSRFRSAFAEVAWAFGLLWISMVDPVAGWCGTSAMLGGAACAAVRGDRGALLAVVGATPLAHAAWLAGDPVGVVALLAALAGRADRSRWALVGVIAIVAAAEGVRQLALEALLPGAAGLAIGVSGIGIAAAAALAAPADPRSAGLGLMLAGALAAGRGQMFVDRVGELPAARAAAEVRARRAVSAWPGVEARAAAEIRAGDDTGVRAIVSAAPTRVAAGEALARARGIGAALDSGWAPGAAVSADLAPGIAWALVARGRLGEARAAVTRVNTATTSFHRAAIADLQGDAPGLARAWAQATTPAGTPIAPGVVWAARQRSGNFEDEVILAVRHAVAVVEAVAVATGCDGAPVLLVRVGSRPEVRLDLARGAVSEPLQLEPGAYRLAVRWENDFSRPGCDRNLEVASVALR